jgi:hypothetical protein
MTNNQNSLKKQLLTIYLTGASIFGLIVTTECLRSGDTVMDSTIAGIGVGALWPMAATFEGFILAQVLIGRAMASQSTNVNFDFPNGV